ncbi:MAG: MaoC family dehydratase [Emcibacter sp.]|nr:MaoC family dehydratase [Emcibacter sp.]
MKVFEDFHMGETAAFGDYIITKEEIIEFAEKYDPQPFHTDPEFAAKSFHGQLIASGWMTAAITMRLICDHVLTESTSIGSPGIDKLRWIKPVYADDHLKATVKILETRLSKSKPNLGIVIYEVIALNHKNEPVMTLNTTGMFLTRAAYEAQKVTS